MIGSRILRLLGKPSRLEERKRRASLEKENSLGTNSVVDPSVQVYGWKNIQIGNDTIISEDTLINAFNRTTEDVILTIGNNSFIGRRNYFNVGGTIRLGDYCLTANDCRFIGSSHNIEDPFTPYLASQTDAEASIEIGANCWLGCAVTVLKNVKIGHGSIIGAASVVTKDVPPFSIVAGNPGRVIKRYSISRKEWVAAAEFSPTEELPEENDYLKILRQSHPNLRGPLQGSSRSFGDF